jgi:hypothetical protein
VDAGELQRDPVLRVQVAAPGEVAAEQRVGAGPDDELVGRVVPAAPVYGPVHRGQDVILEGARAYRVERRVQRRVREPQPRQQAAQLARGLRVGAVDPDADVLHDRSAARLAQVGRAGQRRRAAVGGQNKALEEDVAEAVVVREVVHALLPEHQQGVGAAVLHLPRGAGAPGRELTFCEVQGHPSRPPAGWCRAHQTEG